MSLWGDGLLISVEILGRGFEFSYTMVVHYPCKALLVNQKRIGTVIEHVDDGVFAYVDSKTTAAKGERIWPHLRHAFLAWRTNMNNFCDKSEPI